MAITQAFPRQARLDLLNGVHHPEDDYRIALYTADATLGPETGSYTARGEVRAQGYTAGGLRLSGRRTGVSEGAAFVTFDNPTWPRVTLAARGALVYNASKGGAALAVLDFGQTVTATNGPFTVLLPDPDVDPLVAIL